MRKVVTSLPDILLFEPDVFPDRRGHFFETYNRRKFRELTGLAVDFVQDNHSYSRRNVIRGIHYQIQQPQGKLVRVVAGEVFDIAVDLRKSSASFGKWVGFNLSAESKRMAWIPPGFGHAFLVLSEHAEFLYKTTDYWAPQYERTIRWNDTSLAIRWPLTGEPVLNDKDRNASSLAEAEVFA